MRHATISNVTAHKRTGVGDRVGCYDDTTDYPKHSKDGGHSAGICRTRYAEAATRRVRVAARWREHLSDICPASCAELDRPPKLLRVGHQCLQPTCTHLTILTPLMSLTPLRSLTLLSLTPLISLTPLLSPATSHRNLDITGKPCDETEHIWQRRTHVVAATTMWCHKYNSPPKHCRRNGQRSHCRGLTFETTSKSLTHADRLCFVSAQASKQGRLAGAWHTLFDKEVEEAPEEAVPRPRRV